MLEPSGTPAEGDVPIYRVGQRRTEWGSFQAQIDALQAQIDALGGGSGGVPDPGGLTPNYQNIGGWGDRQGIITPTLNKAGVLHYDQYPNPFYHLVNGVVAYTEQFWKPQADATGIWIKFAFPSPVLITECLWFQANPNGTFTYGTWQWEVSNDNINWTTIGGTFTLNDANLLVAGVGNPNSGQTYLLLNTLSGNTQLWKWYRMKCLSGSWATFPGSCPTEAQFKIAGLD